MFALPSSIGRFARHAGLLALLCLSLGGNALAAAPDPAAPGAKATKAVMPTQAASAQQLTPEERATRERIEKATLGIANLHRSKSGELNCGKCHGRKVAPDDNQTVENSECISCHDGYPEMAEASAEKLSNKALNPHGSHLGPEIACTSCHQGHQESKAYCLHCHTNFSMPMPGNKPAAR